ncbi:MAG: MFS transporter [Chloroflexi bacterium]|nr:MFS transporter [Chloroflexota bacterium]MDA1145681.1 MFS transporter [Chloroflexota bacterium]
MAEAATEPSAPPPVAPARGIRGVYFGWWLVGAAFVAQLISVGAQNYVFGAFQKPMTEELGWSRPEYVAARTIGMALFAMTGLFIGSYVDRHGGRRLMRVGAVLLGAAMFSQSFVQELWQWWLLNGVMLTSGAAMTGNLVVNVTLAKWFVERRGRVAGIAAMGVSFAGIAITPVAAVLIDTIGWREAWRWLAVGAVLILLPVSFLMRRTPEDHGLYPDGKTAAEVAAGGGARAAADYATSLTRAEALRNRSFYLIVIAFGLGGLSIGMILINAIPYMEDAGYSSTTAALMITVVSVPAMLTKPVWGYFIDRIDAKQMSILGFIVTAVSLVLLVFSVRARADVLVYTSFFLLGVGWGGFIPLQEVVWAGFFGRRYLGAVRSAGMPFALFLSASSPLLTAVYFDQVGNYDGAFLAVAFFALVAIGLISLAQKPLRPDAVIEPPTKPGAAAAG